MLILIMDVIGFWSCIVVPVVHVMEFIALIQQFVGAVVAVIGRSHRPCYIHIRYGIVSALIHYELVVMVLLLVILVDVLPFKAFRSVRIVYKHFAIDYSNLYL